MCLSGIVIAERIANELKKEGINNREKRSYSR